MGGVAIVYAIILHFHPVILKFKFLLSGWFFCAILGAFTLFSKLWNYDRFGSLNLFIKSRVLGLGEATVSTGDHDACQELASITFLGRFLKHWCALLVSVCAFFSKACLTWARSFNKRNVLRVSREGWRNTTFHFHEAFYLNRWRELLDCLLTSATLALYRYTLRMLF